MPTRRIILLLALITAPLPVCAQTNPDTSVVNKYISTQAAREHGEEYPEARKILDGDLNNDGTAELVVLYTIEAQNGGNGYVQYLAVFLRQNGKLTPAARAIVGGKYNRAVELESVENGKILLSTLNYTRKDPACCPSRKGSARYILKAGKLRQFNPS